MRLQAEFSMGSKTLEADFGTFQNASDGGYERGYTDGKQAEYDRFWDACQDKGNRGDYSCAFVSQYWDRNIFKPKYDLNVRVSAYMMFRFAGFYIGDLVEHLNSLGVTMSTEGCNNFQYMFYSSQFTHIGEIDMRNGLYLGSAFQSSTRLKTIDKIISAETTAFDNSVFNGCTALENITFEGVIGKNLYLAHSSLLSNASVQSIIDHLKDLTGATAQTLTLHKDVGNKLTQAQKAQIAAKNWTLVY